MQTDRRTDMTKLIVAFRNSANALRKCGLAECPSPGGPSLSTKRDVTSCKPEIPPTTNTKHYNAHSCKTRILKSEKPFFSYHWIPFLHEIKDGKQDEKG